MVEDYILKQALQIALKFALLLASLASLPLILSRFQVILFTEVLILALFALSFNILFGYTGLLSFGHAAYFSIGAYTCALLILRFQSPILLALAASMVVAALAALVIGYFCVRLDEIYFAMLTLAFSQMVFAVVWKWNEVTGGSDGLTGIFPAPFSLFGFEIDLLSTNDFYYFTLALIATSALILLRITNSPFGLALRAIRENADRAQFIGIPVRRYRLSAFIISGSFSGLAGAIFAPFENIVTPSVAHWTKSAEPVMMSLLGGKGSLVGPGVGAFFYTYLQHFISTYTEFWLIYLGAILITFVIFLPQGVIGLIQDNVIPTFRRQLAKAL